MPVTVREVKSRNDYREFVYLPAVIHRGHQQWIPPVWMDEKKFFNPAKNKSFSRCDTIMLLAFREKQVLGRIMGIINHEYNDHKKEKNARFGFMECYDDEQVSHILLRAVEDWARSKGMHRIVGPYGFSDKDPQGFLIEGFEHRAVIAANCNYPYLVQLVEQEGYTREVD